MTEAIFEEILSLKMHEWKKDMNSSYYRSAVLSHVNRNLATVTHTLAKHGTPKNYEKSLKITKERRQLLD